MLLQGIKIVENVVSSRLFNLLEHPSQQKYPIDVKITG